jgi:hypothetical protein
MEAAKKGDKNMAKKSTRELEPAMAVHWTVEPGRLRLKISGEVFAEVLAESGRWVIFWRGLPSCAASRRMGIEEARRIVDSAAFEHLRRAWEAYRRATLTKQSTAPKGRRFKDEQV